MVVKDTKMKHYIVLWLEKSKGGDDHGSDSVFIKKGPEDLPGG